MSHDIMIKQLMEYDRRYKCRIESMWKILIQHPQNPLNNAIIAGQYMTIKRNMTVHCDGIKVWVDVPKTIELFDFFGYPVRWNYNQNKTIDHFIEIFLTLFPEIIDFATLAIMIDSFTINGEILKNISDCILNDNEERLNGAITRMNFYKELQSKKDVKT